MSAVLAWLIGKQVGLQGRKFGAAPKRTLVAQPHFPMIAMRPVQLAGWVVQRQEDLVLRAPGRGMHNILTLRLQCWLFKLAIRVVFSEEKLVLQPPV